MRCASVIVFAASILAPLVSADLHYSGLCVDKVGGESVYNHDATVKACGNYLMRNTGNKQWDQCPDCGMANKGGLDFCHSEGMHIGGDELSYYCKLNGAGGSLAD
ncbi:hypothetical protein BS50DRAFT_4763 [Corynespora cassiicola Philippines]|uniref:RanBP2-type domain-containing protein n=1 Tax=Corynespora cassiicola Philippines TaxID=1448308 RepID=A0A2T2P8R5_CORCC|nr:hypothetical protein BS50DRAFT_4763 [Corynespora cassiicola Philippines]